MPKQEVTRKTGLLAKLGAKVDQAIQTHVNDEVDYGRISLPPGINNGIAQLVQCYFDEYKTGENKGKPYCRMVGVGVSPEEIDTPQGIVRVAGLQTSIMLPCCDTKNSKGEITPAEVNIAGPVGPGKTCLTNEFKKIGGADFLDGCTNGVHLEERALALEQAAPYFKFSTSPRTDLVTKQVTGIWENWHGSKDLGDFSPDTSSQTTDNSPPATQGVKPTTPVKGGNAFVPPPTPPEDESAFDEFGDIDSLAAKADAGDEAAVQQLQAMATAAGISEEDFSATENYVAAAELIKAAEASPDTEQETEPETEPVKAPWIPKKGDTCRWKRTGQLDLKKKQLPPLGVEIVLTDPKNGGTATLKDLTTKKPILGSDKKTALRVPFSELVEA